MDELKEEFYRELLDHISDGIYFVGSDRKITFWNKSAERITGYSSSEVYGKSCTDNILRYIDESGNEVCTEDLCMRSKTNKEAELYLHRKDGVRVPVFVSASPVLDSKKKVLGVVEIFRENIELLAIKEHLKELEEKAVLDPLTGIPNKHFMYIEIEKRIEEYKRYGSRFGIYFIDIDNFKQVNEVYGSDVGDKVLAMVSGTLISILRGSDNVGRWGGDEFLSMVLYTDNDTLSKIGKRLKMLIKNSTLATSTKVVNVTVSIGGTLAKETDSLSSLVSRAESLMLKAKGDGGDKVLIG